MGSGWGRRGQPAKFFEINILPVSYSNDGFCPKILAKLLIPRIFSQRYLSRNAPMATST
jgi:hypothetical protein